MIFFWFLLFYRLFVWWHTVFKCVSFCVHVSFVINKIPNYFLSIKKKFWDFLKYQNCFRMFGKMLISTENDFVIVSRFVLSGFTLSKTEDCFKGYRFWDLLTFSNLWKSFWKHFRRQVSKMFWSLETLCVLLPRNLSQR